LRQEKLTTSYYAALSAAWVIGALPSGVTGAALATGDTTAQKIAKVNLWHVAAPAQDISISGVRQKISGALTQLEGFATGSDPHATTAQLTAAHNLLAVLDLLAGPEYSPHIDTLYTSISDVSAFVLSVGNTLVANANSGITSTHMTELASAISGGYVSWWQANGYRGPITLTDAIIAGLS
jgi:hypothetical protein